MFFYVMGKALTGKLFCMPTGLVIIYTKTGNELVVPYLDIGKTWNRIGQDSME